MEFKQAVITEDGRTLMRKLLSGSKTKFTKLRISSTVYADAQLEKLTALTNVKKEAAVRAYENNPATIVAVGLVDNAGVTVGFDINTVGLYAEDPDKGEILYSVSSAKVKGYIPANAGVSSTAVELRIFTEVSNASNVVMNIEQGEAVTHFELQQFKTDYYDRDEMKDYMARLFAGEEIELTFTEDFTGKVAGSTAENPHTARWGVSTATDMMTPFNWRGDDIDPSPYNGINKLDGNLFYFQRNNANAIARILFSFDLVSSIEKHLPGIFSSLGAKSTGEKAKSLNNLLSNSTVDIYGFGSGSGGKKLMVYKYLSDSRSWEGQPSVITSSSVTKVSAKYSSDFWSSRRVDNQGVVHVLAAAEPFDGTTPSSISIDYASITYTVKLKLSDFLKPKNIWAWSPEGKDGFVDVYPKTNLLKNTTFSNLDSWSAGGMQYSIKNREVSITKSKITTERTFFTTTRGLTPRVQGVYSAQIEIFIESGFKDITGSSFLVRTYLPSGIANDFGTIPITRSMPTDQWIRLTIDSAITNGGTDPDKGMFFILAFGTGSLGTVRVRKPKMENDGLSPYCTNPEEDLLNSFPHYMGTSAVVSDDPTDYSWNYSKEYLDYMFSRMATSAQLTNLATSNPN